MKFLTLIAINLVVLGVFWFRTGKFQGNEGMVSIPLVEHLEKIPSAVAESVPDFREQLDEVEPVESTDSVGVSRQELLQEYWELLLSDKRKRWCPSKRVDMFKELEFIISMSSIEAQEHLNALLSLENVSWYDRRDLVSPLIMQMASKDPVEAISYMLESSNRFQNEDYEGVVRMWMDVDAPGVMDWYESNLGQIKTPLAQAFFSVYAEEDPYDYLVRFGSHTLSKRNSEAVRLLYENLGSSVYENLKNEGLDPKILAGSFENIGKLMFEEDVEKAIDWIQSNRYSVDENTTKELATDLLNDGYYSNEKISVETLEWALKQNVFSSKEGSIKKIVRNLGRWNTERTRDLLQRLQTQSGIDTEELLEELPKPRAEEDDLIYLEPFKVNLETEYSLICGRSFEAVRNY